MLGIYIRNVDLRAPFRRERGLRLALVAIRRPTTRGSDKAMLEKARPEQQVLWQFPDQAGKPFSPPNGTSFMIWEVEFCAKCVRECVAGNHCRILGLALGYGVKDKEYPEEWIYDPYGWGICTAWKSRGGPRRRRSCPKTPDMFGPRPVKHGTVEKIISDAIATAPEKQARVRQKESAQ